MRRSSRCHCRTSSTVCVRALACTVTWMSPPLSGVPYTSIATSCTWPLASWCRVAGAVPNRTWWSNGITFTERCPRAPPAPSSRYSSSPRKRWCRSVAGSARDTSSVRARRSASRATSSRSGSTFDIMPGVVSAARVVRAVTGRSITTASSPCRRRAQAATAPSITAVQREPCDRAWAHTASVSSRGSRTVSRSTWSEAAAGPLPRPSARDRAVVCQWARSSAHLAESSYCRSSSSRRSRPPNGAASGSVAVARAV